MKHLERLINEYIDNKLFADVIDHVETQIASIGRDFNPLNDRDYEELERQKNTMEIYDKLTNLLSYSDSFDGATWLKELLYNYVFSYCENSTEWIANDLEWDFTTQVLENNSNMFVNILYKRCIMHYTMELVKYEKHGDELREMYEESKIELKNENENKQ